MTMADTLDEPGFIKVTLSEDFGSSQSYQAIRVNRPRRRTATLEKSRAEWHLEHCPVLCISRDVQNRVLGDYCRMGIKWIPERLNQLEVTPPRIFEGRTCDQVFFFLYSLNLTMEESKDMILYIHPVSRVLRAVTR